MKMGHSTLGVLAAAAMLALPLSASAQYSASGPGGPIPDGGPTNGTPGVPLTSTATIAGSGGIVDVSVDFAGLAHTWTGDLAIRLTHPNGTTSMDIQSRPGRGSASSFGFNMDYVTANSYSFSDAGADLYAALGPAIIPSGTYRPSSNPNAPTDPVPAPFPYVYTPTSFASTFGGLDSAGDWTLTITDFAAGDTGSLGGWTLNVTVPEPASLGLLTLGLPALLVRRRR